MQPNRDLFADPNRIHPSLGEISSGEGSFPLDLSWSRERIRLQLPRVEAVQVQLSF